MDSLAQVLPTWQNFYMLTGTAAATLIGLMFIAVSLGVHLVTPESISQVRTFVTPTLIHFSTVLVIGLLMTIPTHSWISLGVCFALVGMSGSIYAGGTGLEMWRHHKQKAVKPNAWFWHVVVPGVSYVFVVATALGMGLELPVALHALAVAVVVFLVLAIRNTWDLTLWIAQQR